jgi:hypothetical protein
MELRAEFDGAPVSLALYMGAYLVSAAEDLVGIPSGYLHRRFVGWTRAAHRDAQPLTAAAQQPTQQPVGPRRTTTNPSSPRDRMPYSSHRAAGSSRRTDRRLESGTRPK